MNKELSDLDVCHTSISNKQPSHLYSQVNITTSTKLLTSLSHHTAVSNAICPQYGKYSVQQPLLQLFDFHVDIPLCPTHAGVCNLWEHVYAPLVLMPISIPIRATLGSQRHQPLIPICQHLHSPPSPPITYARARFCFFKSKIVHCLPLKDPEITPPSHPASARASATLLEHLGAFKQTPFFPLSCLTTPNKLPFKGTQKYPLPGAPPQPDSLHHSSSSSSTPHVIGQATISCTRFTLGCANQTRHKPRCKTNLGVSPRCIPQLQNPLSYNMDDITNPTASTASATAHHDGTSPYTHNSAILALPCSQTYPVCHKKSNCTLHIIQPSPNLDPPPPAGTAGSAANMNQTSTNLRPPFTLSSQSSPFATSPIQVTKHNLSHATFPFPHAFTSSAPPPNPTPVPSSNTTTYIQTVPQPLPLTQVVYRIDRFWYICGFITLAAPLHDFNLPLEAIAGPVAPFADAQAHKAGLFPHTLSCDTKVLISTHTIFLRFHLINCTTMPSLLLSAHGNAQPHAFCNSHANANTCAPQQHAGLYTEPTNLLQTITGHTSQLAHGIFHVFMGFVGVKEITTNPLSSHTRSFPPFTTMTRCHATTQTARGVTPCLSLLLTSHRQSCTPPSRMQSHSATTLYCTLFPFNPPPSDQLLPLNGPCNATALAAPQPAWGTPAIAPITLWPYTVCTFHSFLFLRSVNKCTRTQHSLFVARPFPFATVISQCPTTSTPIMIGALLLFLTPPLTSHHRLPIHPFAFLQSPTATILFFTTLLSTFPEATACGSCYVDLLLSAQHAHSPPHDALLFTIACNGLVSRSGSRLIGLAKTVGACSPNNTIAQPLRRPHHPPPPSTHHNLAEGTTAIFGVSTPLRPPPFPPTIHAVPQLEAVIRPPPIPD